MSSQPSFSPPASGNFEVELVRYGIIVATFDDLDSALAHRPTDIGMQHVVRRSGAVVFPPALVGRVPDRVAA